jgi:hypothetical protein
MQLVSCQYSSKINRNHQNNILTVTTGNDDVIIPVATMVGCYAIDGLIPPHSPKMRLTKPKNQSVRNCVKHRHYISCVRMRMAAKVIWVGRAHVQAVDGREVGQAVRMRATVLRCAVAGADGGGGMRWLEPMVEVVCMHVWAPCLALM